MGSGHWLWPRKWLNSRHNCQYLTLFWPLFCKFWMEILHLLVRCLGKIDSFCSLKYLHICREFSVFKWAFKWTLRCPCEYWFRIALSNALTFLLVVQESPHLPQGCLQSKGSSDGFPAVSSHHHPKQRRPFFLYARCFSPVTAFSGSGTKGKLVKNRHFREGNSTRLRKITNTVSRCLVWQDGINTRPSTQHSVQRWWLSSRFSAAVKPCSLPDSSIALPLEVHGERTLLSLDSGKYC